MRSLEHLAKERFEENRAKAPHRLKIVAWEQQSQAVKDMWIDEQKEIAEASAAKTKQKNLLAEVSDCDTPPAQRVTHLAIDPIGKPSWDSHQWPQIVQDSSGNWFGVRDGWTMRVAPTYKGDELWLLREDGEFLSRGECSHGWRTSLEKRPTTQPAPVVLP